MAATVPVMDEDMCTTILSTLFENAKVSLDNVPGLVQLKEIRSALVHLAEDVGLDNKIFKYHDFLCSLASSPRKDPYLAIPVAKDVASIIRMLHKIVTNEEPYVIISLGLRGAAWIMAYACDVLGLPVCAIRADGTSVPVNGSYEDAKVLLKLNSIESKYSLYLLKDLQEHFEFQDFDERRRKGWRVDCTQVNFLDQCHPGVSRSNSLERISAFAALETLNEVTHLATAMTNSEVDQRVLRPFYTNGTPGFMNYTMSELGFIQNRSLKILQHLGFDPGGMEQYGFTADKGCPTHTAHIDVRVHPNLVHESRDDRDQRHYFKAKKLDKYAKFALRYGQYALKLVMNSKLDTKRVRYFIADPATDGSQGLPEGTDSSYEASFLHWIPHMQEKMAGTIDRAVYFAAHLAFSDWDTTFRQMSVNFLRADMTEIRRSNRHHLFGISLECIVVFCIDGFDASEVDTKLCIPDWLAVGFDGVIVHRYPSSRLSIHDLHGKLYGFVNGSIVSDGNHCTQIRSERGGTEHRRSEVSFDWKTFSDCGPKHHFPDLSLRTLTSTIRDTVYVRLESVIDSKLTIVQDISLISQNLPNMLVTEPCEHGYHSQNLDGSYQFDPVKVNLVQRLMSQIEEPRPFPYSHTNMRPFNIYYQLVDNSPKGQWLACQWVPPRKDDLMVIQKNCCIGCVLERLIKTNYRPGGRLHASVIAGGIDDLTSLPRDH